ncbi:carboxyl transferase domain-containing protein [Paenarthrobacter nitroguajacolicus]|uniref:carboxyl transferase domain-containing protein n=1 Tax=Paenarthrobacter nitroguajacolicus TaxID=211146 RepID=UPI00248B03D0|nr:carboxyl transferase domain-containing protein [Paenarthrobacter nitroguajacolicus]MDI2033197.1 putative acetyl-coenzyme A carboxylase carboxyl transferase subunit beta [Paenarthrobacter nitroguajacolicus]
MAATATRRRLGARELLDHLLDAGTYVSWDSPVQGVAEGSGNDGYAADLASARDRSGSDESVLTGEGRIRNHRVAVVVSDFAFLAGSIGRDAAHRLVSAVERATDLGLPLVAMPASGGTRMQEGTPAFLAMVEIVAAVQAHRTAGLPYLVYLRHPTTGGVMASWGSLGHVTAAEPGALLGFLGPRVYEALHGEAFPAGVQTAENLFDHGLVDAVVPPEGLGDYFGRILDLLQAGTCSLTDDALPTGPLIRSEPVPGTAWNSVLRSRDPLRPSTAELLEHAASNVVLLRGAGDGTKDEGMLVALARLGATPCVVVGHQRNNAMGPASLRDARRGMRLAKELRLPLVTVIDTPGALLSREAEEGGLAAEIARSLYDLLGLAVPTLSVLLGQGTGGGALALLPADRTIAARNAWLAPLPPEGASAIVHRTTSRAAELAESQGITAAALAARGVVDVVVDEVPDAAAEPVEFCRRLGEVIGVELFGQVRRGVPGLQARRSKYRALIR